ncbi:MAG: hypothetical protein C4293_17705 [Nitrospiraceae bacterium]
MSTHLWPPAFREGIGIYRRFTNLLLPSLSQPKTSLHHRKTRTWSTMIVLDGVGSAVLVAGWEQRRDVLRSLFFLFA